MSNKPQQHDADFEEVSWAQLAAVLLMLCSGGVAWFIYLIWLLGGILRAARG